MNFRHILSLLLLVGLLFTDLKAQELEPADQIVAIVNSKIILKSDIDQDVVAYMQQAQSYGQPVPFTEGLWYQFLNAAIENEVLLEKARIDSVVVPDDQVNQQMDNRVAQLVQQAGSQRALEEAFGKSIIQVKAQFREEFRQQMIVEQVRRNKMVEISITRPEVREFFESIPKDSLPTIPEQVSLSQLVILPPPKADARNEAIALAESIRDSLINHGVPFEELARRHGTDGTAQRGGLLPMMPLNQLVAEYSAAASALQPGEISEVVETEFGFHVIKLVRRVGDQIETRHILIKIKADELDDEYAINRLNAIRDSLLNNPNLKFSDLAREFSEDKSTKGQGGKIIDPQSQERLIALNRLDPALYRAVLLMDEVGTISEPKPFNPNNANSGKGYRIIRLDRQVPEHIADFTTDYDRLKGIALQQKQFKVYSEWIEKLKKDFYIEYRIPMPNNLAENN